MVELIYNITERTIAERIEKGELAKVEKPKKTTKVQVTESQLAELVKTGRVLNVKKKIKLVKEGDGQSEYNIAQNILQLLQSKYNEEPHYEVDIIESITKYMTRKIANMQKQGYEVKVEVIGQYVKELVNKIQINDLEPEDAYNIASNIIGHSMPKGQPQQGQGPARPTAPVQ